MQVRRRLHSYPELSFEEHETSRFIVEALSKLSFRIRIGYSPTAVVAELGSSPFIGLRSDMDALPIQEQNLCAYVSSKPGIMHACGHDAHMACLLAAARLLSQNASKLKKGIRLIFEPGSESKERSGARELIDNGVLQDLEGIIGFHVDSTLPAFDISVVRDAGLQSKSLQITLNSDNNDSIQILGNLICKLEERFPGTCGRSAIKLLQFAKIETARQKLQLHFIINAENQERLSESLTLVQDLCQSLSSGSALELSTQQSNSAHPNGTVSGEFLLQTIEEICSQERLRLTSRRTWSKDFELYGEHVSTAFFYLGTSCGTRSHHSSSFEIDERPLYLATAVLAKAAFLAASNANEN